jgi:dUTP pyrophosphatase
VRSSSPLKYWIMLANGVGIIDADYYNNPDNEGEIFF